MFTRREEGNFPKENRASAGQTRLQQPGNNDLLILAKLFLSNDDSGNYCL
jgi:hypothetical protein